MKCENCSTGRAEVILNWATKQNPTKSDISIGAVCECCAAEIWSRISPATEAYQTFTITPFTNKEWDKVKEQF